MQTILGILVAGMLLIFGIGYYNHAQAELMEAQARMIVAQAEADALRAEAEAAQVRAWALLVAAAGGSAAALIATTAGLVYAVRHPYGSQQLIEQRVFFMLPADISRREIWELMSDKVERLVEGDLIVKK